MRRAAAPSEYIGERSGEPGNRFVPVLLPFLRPSKSYLARSLGVSKLPVIAVAQGRIRGRSIAVADPCFGAPAAVLVLEEAVKRGYMNFLFLGACGGLDRRLRIGDIILPEESISEEGTSKLYTRSGPKFRPDSGLRKLLGSTAEDLGMKVKRGLIWTTDAPYRETPAKIARYRHLGAVGVEMETSALFAVAKHRRAHIAGLLVVSDLLHDKWIIGWHRRDYRMAENRARTAIVEAAIRLSDRLRPA